MVTGAEEHLVAVGTEFRIARSHCVGNHAVRVSRVEQFVCLIVVHNLDARCKSLFPHCLRHLRRNVTAREYNLLSGGSAKAYGIFSEAGIANTVVSH